MADTETLRVIKRRRSIRSYQDKQITDEELRAVLEAGMYAPNAGDQAWHFTVVQNKDLLRRLNQAAKDAARQLDINGLSDLGNDPRFDCLYGAPTLVIVSGDQQAPVPLDADCAAANQNMLLAAESLGLGSCWIYFVLLAFESVQADDLRKELKMPEGTKAYAAALLGYTHGRVDPPVERKPGLVTVIR